MTLRISYLNTLSRNVAPWKSRINALFSPLAREIALIQSSLNIHDHNHGHQGALAKPGFWKLIFSYVKYLARNDCFLSFGWEKWYCTTFGRGKLLILFDCHWENSTNAPPTGKILPSHADVSKRNSVLSQKVCPCLNGGCTFNDLVWSWQPKILFKLMY